MSAKTRGAMKNSKRQWPKRAIALFVLIVVVIYALIFLTGNRQGTPKLGIDLQGGTRVTLAPQGEEPTQDQLKQARNILEQRVNGMGVFGSEVVINGNTLVITVPGEDASRHRPWARPRSCSSVRWQSPPCRIWKSSIRSWKIWPIAG